MHLLRFSVRHDTQVHTAPHQLLTCVVASCFDRAFQFADDSNMADVWYNLGQVRTVFLVNRSLSYALQAAIGVGDLGLAYQAFKISISCDNCHAESYCNLGVLELRKHNVEQVLATCSCCHR